MSDTQTSSWLAPALTAMGSFATAIAGFIAMRFLDAKKDDRTYQREKAARDNMRGDKAREKHIEFQRQTLIDLQDAFLKLIHSASAIHTNNSNIFGDESWKDGAAYRPNELSVMHSDAQAKTMILIGRVADDATRELATKTKWTAHWLTRQRIIVMLMRRWHTPCKTSCRSMRGSASCFVNLISFRSLPLNKDDSTVRRHPQVLFACNRLEGAQLSP